MYRSTMINDKEIGISFIVVYNKIVTISNLNWVIGKIPDQLSYIRNL